MKASSLGLSGCLLLLGISSCREIIGIEPADVDPTLTGSGGGALGGAANALMTGATTATGGTQGGDGQAEAGTPGAGGASDGGRPAKPEVAGDSAAGEGGAVGAPTLCEQYCAAVTENCTAAFAVYTSQAACLAVCAALPAGKAGDRTGNSVECRLHAAQIAKDEVPHYCPIAGPGGNGVCGSNCESLCGLREQICSEYSSGDVDECLTGCAKLQDVGIYSTDLSVGLYSGPHVQCRLYHVSAAAADDAEQHCPHVDGAAPCQ